MAILNATLNVFLHLMDRIFLKHKYDELRMETIGEVATYREKLYFHLATFLNKILALEVILSPNQEITKNGLNFSYSPP